MSLFDESARKRVDFEIEMGDSFDYSFMGIVNIQDLVVVEKSRDNDETTPIKPRSKISSIRLQSNKIENISILHGCIESIGLVPRHVKWIDLSNNNISHIGESLENFHGLSVLYLHANNIKNLSEVKALSNLKKLTSITLFGNPIESHKHYKKYVLYLFPSLSKLDFSVITNQDREDCRAWASVFRKWLKEGQSVVDV